MRILYVTTIGITMGFFKSIVKELIDIGNTVDIATNEKFSEVPGCFREWGCRVFNISTSRSPFSFGNIRAIKQIRNIAKNYDIVHCHTPLAGMATRLACKRLRKKQGLKVVYTAHGFHFYKGSPKKNWLIYYPIEKLCSRWTDVLITINREDFELAKKKMRAIQNEYIPGVGINIRLFSDTFVDKTLKRKEIGIPENAFLILSVGELNENKNHRFVIKAISMINDNTIYYAIAGVGDQDNNLVKLANDLGVNLRLLGYRKDVKELYKISDLFILPSYREGLNVSMLEAIASGTSVLVSRIRGNTDVVPDKNCFSPYCEKELANMISKREWDMNIPADKYDVRGINESIVNLYKKITNIV